MKIVGLTGGIGSGKSTVAAMFHELGVPVYNSDERAKHLMNTSVKIKEQLIQLLGQHSYRNEELNRNYIAKKVFDNAPLLAKLNGIVHPVVRKDFLEWSNEQHTPYVIQETALLFENDAQKLYDCIILVTAPKEERIQRVLNREKMTKEQVVARMNNQLSDATKLELANFLIENIELERTRSKVLEVHESILADC